MAKADKKGKKQKGLMKAQKRKMNENQGLVEKKTKFGKNKKEEKPVEDSQELIETSDENSIQEDDFCQIEDTPAAPSSDLSSSEEETVPPIDPESDEEETDDDESENIPSENDASEPDTSRPKNGAPQVKTQQENRSSSFSHGDVPSSKRLFIASLAPASTSESISDFFESHGLSLTDVCIPGGPRGHKGFAFVELKSMEEANRAVSLDGNQLDGSSISITFAKPRRGEAGAEPSRGSSGTNILFVRNLGPTTTKDDIKNHFSGASDVVLATGQDGSCLGHAYIEYPNSDMARNANSQLRASNLNGSKIFVDFAHSTNDSERSNSSFRGGFSGRGHFDSSSRRGGSFGGEKRGFRGGFGQSGRGFSRGGGGNFNRGGPSFKRGGGGMPRGNKIQFNDDD